MDRVSAQRPGEDGWGQRDRLFNDERRRERDIEDRLEHRGHGGGGGSAGPITLDPVVVHAPQPPPPQPQPAPPPPIVDLPPVTALPPDGPLPSYGDLLAERREQRRYATDEEYRQFWRGEQQRILQFGLGPVMDAIDMVRAPFQGRWGDTAWDALSLFGGKFLGLAGKWFGPKFIGWAASGPLALLFKPLSAAQWRHLPGRASGGLNLPEVNGHWLLGSHGNAGLIPGQIAEKLNGMQFRNFGEFRAQFWKEVANDPNLSKQFSEYNIYLMKSGRSPLVDDSQIIDGQRSYMLHHRIPIQHGGAVYDMNNIVVVTPRYHQDILDRGYHYRSRTEVDR